LFIHDEIDSWKHLRWCIYSGWSSAARFLTAADVNTGRCGFRAVRTVVGVGMWAAKLPETDEAWLCGSRWGSIAAGLKKKRS